MVIYNLKIAIVNWLFYFVNAFIYLNYSWQFCSVTSKKVHVFKKKEKRLIFVFLLLKPADVLHIDTGYTKVTPFIPTIDNP